MKHFFVIIFSFCALAIQANANCLEGKFKSETYSIEQTPYDNYGRFASTLTLSKSGVFKGKGQYFVSEDGGMAYAETHYKSATTKKVAVLTMDAQPDGTFYTLCIGKSLKRAKDYDCISCLDNVE